MRADRIGHLLGVMARFGGGAVAFGLWQHSIAAGVFAFFALTTVDTK